MMCENNCYLNTPTSVTEKRRRDSNVPHAVVEGQERTPCPSAEMETRCCGCATEQAVDGRGVVEVDARWEWEELAQNSQHVEEQSEELTSVNRRSFLQIWWSYFKGATF